MRFTQKKTLLSLVSSVTHRQSLWSAETCGNVNEQLRTACEAATSEAPVSAQHFCRKEKRYVAQATTADSITLPTSPVSHQMITSIWRINKCPHYPHCLGTLSWPLWQPRLYSVCFSRALRVCLPYQGVNRLLFLVQLFSLKKKKRIFLQLNL